MRKSFLFTLTIALGCAASAGRLQAEIKFVNGQAARLIIGQPSFTAQLPSPTSATILGGVSGLALFNETLFVVDSSRVGAAPDNHRVLLFNNIGSQVPGAAAELTQGTRCPACVGEANVVVGQSGFDRSSVARTASGLRLPTAVSSDGQAMAVADTDNNRVLIWRSIPATNGAPADVVLGQESFTSLGPIAPTNRTFRGPQGVWIQNGRLFVADTQNHRVLIWNSIPATNYAPADVVLGQRDFNTAPDPNLVAQTLNAQNNTLLNPVSVTSDGVRLIVSDLGHNRVLIWNTIPTSTQAPADIVLGQAEFTTAFANNAPTVCPSNGSNADGPTYPLRCAATLSFPRYALSDGKKLFIADGGNDRVLIWNAIPTQNGQNADVVLGQVNFDANNTSDSAFPGQVSAADVIRTPMSLAWDGMNLFVSDPFNRRVLVWTMAEPLVPYSGVRNSASFEVFAIGTVNFAGMPKENDEVTVTIQGKEFKYRLKKDDTAAQVISALIALINAGEGDPNVLATSNASAGNLLLTARAAAEAGNAITLGTAASEGATITVTASGATLNGGQNAAQIAPGTIVTLVGSNLADQTATAPGGGTTDLPTELGGVQVYIDGIRAPLLFVSPSQINAQMPWEVRDTTSVNAVVRSVRADGQVVVSGAVGVPIITQNPGIYAVEGTDPRPGVVLHGSSFATGTVSVDGTAKENDTATIIVNGREYSYRVLKDDTLARIRDGLVTAINLGDGDPELTATAAGVFTRIRLEARARGADGNGIPIATRISDTAQVILTATNATLCCANEQGAPVTEENPVIPGETIILYATGLGAIFPQEAQDQVVTGQPYAGPEQNEPLEFVSSLAGGKTANVLFARLKPGLIGLYEVVLELNSDLPSNLRTQVTIAQSFQVSNIVTFALFNPNPPAP